MATIRALLIYPGMSVFDRIELDRIWYEVPERGLLFLRECDVYTVFGEPFRGPGQIISPMWMLHFQHLLRYNSPRLDGFYRFAFSNIQSSPLDVLLTYLQRA
jgi:hypothetical protein